MLDNPPQSAKIPPSALPLDRDGVLDWLRLYRSYRVGPVTFIRLIREHGSATAALAALPSVASASGARNYVPFSRANADAELVAGAAAGAQLLLLGSAQYPSRLATISDPPAVLWAIGNPEIAARPTVAFVGARNSSSLGRRMSSRLAQELVHHGYVIVSGLARGIDAEAHSAALSGGTIAVQAGGVDNIYPKENIALANRIAEKGLRLSEMPIGLQAQSRHFPRRNRIISGLSQGVIVIEGASRSGSLITAKNALDQGREVMAVPGNPLDGRAAGCNMLIRDGATLIRSAADVIEVIPQHLPIEVPHYTQQTPKAPSEGLPAELLALLGPNPVSEDILMRQVQRPASEVLAALVDLELSRKIERHSGGGVAVVI